MLLEQRKVTEQVDARALPVVLAGLLLSTFPEGLTKLPLLGVIVFCLGVSAVVGGYYLLDSTDVRASRRR